MATRHIRGDFPKGPADESAADKRLRYEQWVIETHAALPPLKPGHRRILDPEFDAIMAQSYRWDDINNFPKTGSKILAIKARCWQCVGEDDEASNIASIAQCTARNCALWSVRPFQPKEDKIPNLPIKEVVRVGFKKLDFLAKALAHPGSRPQAIKGYCHVCKGGESSHNTRRAVFDCADANCALWYCRGKPST